MTKKARVVEVGKKLVVEDNNGTFYGFVEPMDCIRTINEFNRLTGKKIRLMTRPRFYRKAC